MRCRSAAEMNAIGLPASRGAAAAERPASAREAAATGEPAATPRAAADADREATITAAIHPAIAAEVQHGDHQDRDDQQRRKGQPAALRRRRELLARLVVGV